MRPLPGDPSSSIPTPSPQFPSRAQAGARPVLIPHLTHTLFTAPTCPRSFDPTPTISVSTSQYTFLIRWSLCIPTIQHTYHTTIHKSYMSTKPILREITAKSHGGHHVDCHMCLSPHNDNKQSASGLRTEFSTKWIINSIFSKRGITKLNKQQHSHNYYLWKKSSSWLSPSA